MSTTPVPLHDLDTPCFVLDELRAVENCNIMRQKTEAKGIKLRPHQKTHKTKELALAMCGGDKNNGIVVSTLTEAEFFADDGFQDILYASPLAVHRLPRCQSLAARINHFHVIMDNEETLKHLAATPLHGKASQWSVFLFINVGYRREGVRWDSEEVVRLATQFKQLTNVKLTGIYTHCGQSYSAGSKDSAHRVAVDTFSRMSDVNRRLVEIGFQNLVVSMGSTPSCSAISAADNFEMVNEIHPGNYVFYDWENMLVGSCEEQDIACWVMTRIVGLYPEQNLILIDCGFTALSHDRSALKWQQIGFANILNHPELKMEGMTQELGKLTSIDGVQLDFSKYHLGELMFLQPWHSCAAAALHSQYQIVRLGRSTPVQGSSLRVTTWQPCREWGPL